MTTERDDGEAAGWLWTARQVAAVADLGFWLRLHGWVGAVGAVLAFLFTLLVIASDVASERASPWRGGVRVVLQLATTGAVGLVAARLIGAGRRFARAAGSRSEFGVQAGLADLRFVFRLSGWLLLVALGLAGLAAAGAVALELGRAATG